MRMVSDVGQVCFCFFFTASFVFIPPTFFVFFLSVIALFRCEVREQCDGIRGSAWLDRHQICPNLKVSLLINSGFLPNELALLGIE